MQVHHKNFGAKTSVRCGFLEGIYTFPEHLHQFPEIVYVKYGEMEVTVDGISATMKSGDIAIIPPFSAHSFYTPEYVKRWVCVFSNDFLKNLFPGGEDIGRRTPFVFSASEGLLRYIEDKTYDSGEYFFDMSDSDILMFRALIFAIYEEYLRQSEPCKARPQNKALSAILLYISEHYREGLTLSKIGAAVGYAPKYVSLCLGEVEEMNLHFLINSFRADEAKAMLLTTEATMADIAEQCGYASERSFLRAFKQVTGATPGEYRKKRRTPKSNDNEKMYYPELYKRKKHGTKI